MPEKKSGKTKAQKPQVIVADLEPNSPNAESGEQKPGPKGGDGRYNPRYVLTAAWPQK